MRAKKASRPLPSAKFEIWPPLCAWLSRETQPGRGKGKGENEMHTPGPWTLDIFGDDKPRGISGEDGLTIAIFDDRVIPSIANARLIASAPALLEACRKIDAIG